MSRYAACLCTDRKMLVPALYAASEIKARSRAAGNDLDVIVFTPPGEVNDVARAWMAARDIMLDESFDTSKWSDLVLVKRLHPATLIRLMLAPHLAGRYDKVLYLDCDITVHAAVDSIFRLDTGDAPIAACGSTPVQGPPERQAQTEAHLLALEMTPPYRFFNSGVLLIDLEKWNAMELGERVLEKIRAKPQVFWLPDEHGLNSVLNGRYAELSPIWNARIDSWKDPKLRAMLDPVFVHYDGMRKPWKRYGKEKRFVVPPIGYEHYADFVRDTPWSGWLRQQWTLVDLVKSIREEWRQRPSQRAKADAARVAAGFVSTTSRVGTMLTTPFADVTQGIATQEGGRLRLAES